MYDGGDGGRVSYIEKNKIRAHFKLMAKAKMYVIFDSWIFVLNITSFSFSLTPDANWNFVLFQSFYFYSQVYCITLDEKVNKFTQKVMS